MILIDNQIFQNEVVELDNCHFVGCTLINCVLEYHGGEVVFDRTTMRSCRHVFFGRARRTLHYLQGVGLMQYEPSDWGEFPASVH